MAVPLPNFATINHELINITASATSINRELTNFPNLINQANIERIIDRVAERFGREVTIRLNRMKKAINHIMNQLDQRDARWDARLNRMKEEITTELGGRIDQMRETLLNKIMLKYVLIITHTLTHPTLQPLAKRIPPGAHTMFMRDLRNAYFYLTIPKLERKLNWKDIGSLMGFLPPLFQMPTVTCVSFL